MLCYIIEQLLPKTILYKKCLSAPPLSFANKPQQYNFLSVKVNKIASVKFSEQIKTSLEVYCLS